MRIFTLTLFILLLAPAAQAQVVLQKSADLPGRYVVEFASAQDAFARFRAQKSRAFEALRRQQVLNVARLENDLRATDLVIVRDLWLKQALAISLSADYLPRLRALDYVRSVRADQQFRARPQGVVTLPLSGELVQDNLARVEIDPLWNDHYRGQGVVVAILDSGVDPQHDDLAERWRGGSNSWFDPYQQQPVPKDLTGHGTAVGSIVLGGDAAGSYLGVAPGAQWIAARIFDNTGNSSESAISAVLQWIVDPDGSAATDDYPDIVQNSWGLAGTEGACANPFATELALIDALGIDQVFAVGNSGISGPGPGGFSSYLTPAFDAHVISVGALRATDTLLFASSRGPDLCGSSIIPSLVAPGELIRTADITFGGFDPDNTTVNTGTSFSSPHVSGVLALLRSKYRAVNYLQYRDAVFDSAIDLGDPDEYGRGLAQASAAASLLQGLSVPLQPDEVGFSDAVYLFSEAAANASVSVIRSGNIDASASVDIHSIDGTANDVDDYQAVLATLDFAAGEAVKHVSLQFTNDAVDEINKTFSLQLSQNVNVNLGSRTTTVITIDDDDGPDEEAAVVGGMAVGILELSCLCLFSLGRWCRR